MGPLADLDALGGTAVAVKYYVLVCADDSAAPSCESRGDSSSREARRAEKKERKAEQQARALAAHERAAAAQFAA